MIAISKVKQIITEAFSLVILIPLVIACVILLVLFNSLVYELAILFFVSAIVGGAVLFTTKWFLSALLWMIERTSKKNLIDYRTIDIWSERIGITVGGLVFAYCLFDWSKKIYVALTS